MIFFFVNFFFVIFGGVSCGKQMEVQGVSDSGIAGEAWGLTARRILAGASLFRSSLGLHAPAECSTAAL